MKSLVDALRDSQSMDGTSKVKIMEYYDLNSFEDFPNLIESIKQKYAKSHGENGNELFAKMLFRGHACDTWKLESTLERFQPNVNKWSQYARLASLIAPEVFANISKQYEILPRKELIKQGLQYGYWQMPCYEFMVYLRHHGFPSPLLDWSGSPYVAMHFASIQQESDYSTIFVFIEMPNYEKSRIGLHPQICTHGHYVNAHKRHFLQQCEYSTCTQEHMSENGEVIDIEFKPHFNAIGGSTGTQDVIVGIRFKSELKLEFRRKLAFMNITAHSLMLSEDSLMQTLADKHLLMDWQ